MKKTSDWFFAGVVAGVIGGIFHILYNYILIRLGIQHAPFWQSIGGLFYNKELLTVTSAQIHGMIDVLGICAANGIILSLILLVTGKNYLYTKSVIMSASSAYFLFLVVYPQTGVEKNSLILPWIALFGHIVFNGLLTGYLLHKMCTEKTFAKH